VTCSTLGDPEVETVQQLPGPAQPFPQLEGSGNVLRHRDSELRRGASPQLHSAYYYYESYISRKIEVSVRVEDALNRTVEASQ
jgi:hypothetical protein